jgi:hypothetical protein
MSTIDPRDFYDGPEPEGEPFELVPDPFPRFGIGPDGIDNLRRALGLPKPPEGGELGDPEREW